MTGKTYNPETTTYSYDLENRLTSVVQPTETTSFTYTGDGMRRSKTTGESTTNYLYDRISTIGETDGTGTLTNSYTTDPTRQTGQITSKTDASEVTSFYSYDGPGSTRNLTDQTENTTAGYSYDAFGNVLNHTGQSATYTFSTKEEDTTGLYYFAARYYNPETGRFTTQDPYPANLFDPQSLNRYVYCENDPINYVDPLGLKSTKCQTDAETKAFTGYTGNEWMIYAGIVIMDTGATFALAGLEATLISMGGGLLVFGVGVAMVATGGYFTYLGFTS